MKDKNQAFESETDLDAAGTGIFRFMEKAEKWVFFGEMPPFLRIVSAKKAFFDEFFSKMFASVFLINCERISLCMTVRYQ